MKPRIVAAIDRIAGDRLTQQMKEEIATEAIRIVDEVTRNAAQAAARTFENVVETEKNKRHE